MFKKFLPFLVLGPIANMTWLVWVLPDIGEQGTFSDELQWIAVQLVLPLIFSIFLLLRRRFILWAILVYSGFSALFALGVLGWALMGPETPYPVYLVVALLFIMSFGLIYQALTFLNIGKKERFYGFQD